MNKKRARAALPEDQKRREAYRRRIFWGSWTLKLRSSQQMSMPARELFQSWRILYLRG